MYDYFKCFKFHDVALSWSLGPLFTFASNYYQTALLFIPEGHFYQKKNNDFWEAGKCSNMVFDVSCWQNHHQTFGRFCSKKPTKFVLIVTRIHKDFGYSSNSSPAVIFHL